MSVVVAILGVLRGNWTWAIPCALLVAVGGYAAVQHWELADLRASVATERLAAVQAAREYLEANQTKVDELAAARDAVRTAEEGKANAEQNRIAAAPRSVVCTGTDAFRAWYGVQPSGTPGDRKP